MTVVDVIPCTNGWQYILLLDDGSLALGHVGFTGEGPAMLAKPLPVVEG